MKENLLNILSRIIKLLIDCGLQDMANWFDKAKTVFEINSIETDEFQQKLCELDSILTGMGSFSDLPLSSKSGKLSDQEIRNIQWELVEDIGDAIDKLKIG